jgi:hypothetical protein
LIAQREINEKSDIHIEFERIKPSRKIEGIKFIISKNKAYELRNNPVKETQEVKRKPAVIDTLREFGLSLRVINHILKDLYVVITNEPKNTHSQFNEIIITQEKKIDHIEAAKSRLFHSLNVFLIVVKKTPEKTNYYFGKSYEGLIYVFVPRILLPSKPEQLYGHFWGKRYEVLDVSDNITSWNFPVLAEKKKDSLEWRKR